MTDSDDQFYRFVQAALEEDLGDGDHSTLSCISAEARGRAELRIKQEGILAGIRVAENIFRQADPQVQFTGFKRDGESMATGERAFELEASVYTILQCERLVLNCLQRMSGIATLTRQFSEKLK